MLLYRIVENTFEDGRKEFIPQFRNDDDIRKDTSGQIIFIYFNSFINNVLVPKKFKTYDEALLVIEEDKLIHMNIIETKIHEL